MFDFSSSNFNLQNHILSTSGVALKNITTRQVAEHSRHFSCNNGESITDIIIRVHEARPKCKLDFGNALAHRLHAVKKINAMFRE
jgi:hypothetical protein